MKSLAFMRQQSPCRPSVIEVPLGSAAPAWAGGAHSTGQPRQRRSESMHLPTLQIWFLRPAWLSQVSTKAQGRRPDEIDE